MGLETKDFNAPRDRGGRQAKDYNVSERMEATYDYRDENGELLFQVVRFVPKTFRQRRPKQGGGWEWGLNGTRRVLYRLPELIAGAKRKVLIVEGEKDVDNLTKLGLLATTNPMGALKWTKEDKHYSAPLRDRHCIVIADHDPIDEKVGYRPGLRHAEQVCEALVGFAASVRLIKSLPDMPEETDVSDWIEKGGTKEKLIELMQNAPLLWERGKKNSGTSSPAPSTSKSPTAEQRPTNNAPVSANEPSRERRLIAATRIIEKGVYLPDGEWLAAARSILTDFERGA